MPDAVFCINLNGSAPRAKASSGDGGASLFGCGSIFEKPRTTGMGPGQQPCSRHTRTCAEAVLKVAMQIMRSYLCRVDWEGSVHVGLRIFSGSRGRPSLTSFLESSAAEEPPEGTTGWWRAGSYTHPSTILIQEGFRAQRSVDRTRNRWNKRTRIN